MYVETDTAVILSAGFGQRMLPITEEKPKPLIEVGGKALIDWLLDDLSQNNIENVIVNLHYKATMLRKHLVKRKKPKIFFSDETNRLLDTGGGVKKLLPLINKDIFLVFNSDGLWKNGLGPIINKFRYNWSSNTEALICLAKKNKSYGYEGKGDFYLNQNKIPCRPEKGNQAPYIYSGAQMVHKSLFQKEDKTVFSFNILWDKASENKSFRGFAHEDEWYHVGRPDAIKSTTQALKNC